MIEHFLQPGEHFVGDERHRVHTILGSCVSITLWHPARRIGAISHFLLVNPSPRGDAPLDGRYGTESMTLLARRLSGFGIEARQCEAKLFGGGDMFPGQVRNPAAQVGRRNGDHARAILAAHGIAVFSESLFGVGHRRIIFDIATGDVWVRQSSPASIHGGLA